MAWQALIEYPGASRLRAIESLLRPHVPLRLSSTLVEKIRNGPAGLREGDPMAEFGWRPLCASDRATTPTSDLKSVLTKPRVDHTQSSIAPTNPARAKFQSVLLHLSPENAE